MNLDKTDIQILNKLQGNGRIKRNELTEITGLSLPSVSERLRKLEDAGYIKKYTAILNHKKLNYDITAFIAVAIDSSKHYDGFIDKAGKTIEIQECHAITGSGSHILKVKVKDTEALEKLLSKIQAWPGVTATHTNVALSSPKESTEIKI